MSWGIAETASEIEKIKSESADYLNGLNSCGVIDWNTYNYAFDFYENLLMKAYEQGEKDAQPDPCDDPRADVYYLAEKIGIHRLYALVVALRGEPEPCKDAVSREALRKAMYHRAFETNGDTMWQSGCWIRYRAVEQVIKDSPTVTPKRKTGKWIAIDDADDSIRISGKCSACGWEAHLYEDDVAGMDYCPNCGAKMI